MANPLDPDDMQRMVLRKAEANAKGGLFDLFELRAVDDGVSDDMLLCIDALRWGQSDLHSLVPDGDRRRMECKGGDRPVGPKWPEPQ